MRARLVLPPYGFYSTCGVLTVNLSTLSFYCSRTRLKIYRKAAKKGQLVVMSSVAGIRCYATGPVYCATKWALQGLCGSVRMDLKGTGVKLGTVNPGGVATPWWTEADRGGKPTPATQEKLDSLLSPEDVAQATMTLVDQSSTSNIEMISLDPPE